MVEISAEFDHPKVSEPVSIAYRSGLRVGSPDSAPYVLGFDHPKVSELPDALAFGNHPADHLLGGCIFEQGRYNHRK